MSKSQRSGSGSGSESDSGSQGSVSRSPSPQIAPTPGHSLEHHDSRSNSPQQGDRRSRSDTPLSGSQLHIADVDSRSRSGTPIQGRSSRSRSRSRSHSAATGRSRSGSAHSAGSGSLASNASPARHSKSRSVSRAGSGSPGSPSRTGTVEKRRRGVISESGSDGGGGGGGVDGEGVTGTSGAPVRKKKSTLIDTDDSDDDVPTRAAAAPDAGALFGDADDISTDDDDDANEAAKAKSSSEIATADRRRQTDSDTARRSADSDSDRNQRRRDSRSSRDERSDDDDNARAAAAKQPEPEPEPIPERRIDVEIPRIVADLGRDIHFVKLPNFLSVDTRPFDPETYEDEIDEEETLDEEGRQRIKLKVSNTMRWREHMNDDGAMVRESNTRIVKWSDGSMSLHLGNEIFDVYKQPLQGDHNHLFIRQGTGLQGQAVFRTKLTFRPHSTESFTHKKMTMSLADRSQKTSGIKILTQVGYDPDTDRMMNLKKEEEKLRQAMRAKTTATKPKRGRAGGDGTLAAVEHDSDDEGAISIAAIKNKYKKGGAAGGSAGGASGSGSAGTKSGAAIYSSDEEDSDLETRRSKRVDKSKASRALRDSDDDDDDDEDEDVDSGSGSDGGTTSKPTPRGNQIESDED